ncbi:MAG: alpha/beta hydrolase [Deltaproteobacteria bacterium]|nr:alpha/beta hydrolase [Deltaproteobacteria bacterium]
MLDRLQRFFIFPRFAVEKPRGRGGDVEGLVRLERVVEGGTVEAWVMPGLGASGGRPGPAVIFAHGNGALIDDWPEVLGWYVRHGVTVLLPEYRGYGRSGGRPSERDLTEDFVWFHDLAAGRAEVDGERIFFHGRSIGGGVVCGLAGRRRPRAMILQSTFTSLRRVMRRFLVPGFLVSDPFENLEVVRRLDVPILVFHGERDRLVPFAHAEELVGAARRGRLVAYPGVDHNGCPPDWGAFFGEVERFLGEVGIVG